MNPIIILALISLSVASAAGAVELTSNRVFSSTKGGLEQVESVQAPSVELQANGGQPFQQNYQPIVGFQPELAPTQVLDSEFVQQPRLVQSVMPSYQQYYQPIKGYQPELASAQVQDPVVVQQPRLVQSVMPVYLQYYQPSKNFQQEVRSVRVQEPAVQQPISSAPVQQASQPDAVSIQMPQRVAQPVYQQQLSLPAMGYQQQEVRASPVQEPLAQASVTTQAPSLAPTKL